MTNSRTIDNLGVETSVRWANDQQLLDKTLVQEASQVSKQTAIDIYAPFYKSEFDLIFETKRRYKQWAAFFAPPGYSTQKMRIFLHQIIPSLGIEEFQQTQIKKIRSQHENNQTMHKKKKGADQTSRYNWEEKQAAEEVEKESKILINLIKQINYLDQLLGTINARRSQYSKG